MIDLKYSLVIEATEDPTFFGFYSPDLEGIVQILAPSHLRGRLIGLFTMSAFRLRAFSGVTVGVVGGLIGYTGRWRSAPWRS